MVKLCIKIYSSGVSTADNVATVTVPQHLTLVGVTWHARCINAGAVGGCTMLQLSTMGSSSWGSNDVRGIISEAAIGSSAGVNINDAINFFVAIGGIKFNAGDVIRLHRQGLIAQTTCDATAELQFV